MHAWKAPRIVALTKAYLSSSMVVRVVNSSQESTPSAKRRPANDARNVSALLLSVTVTFTSAFRRDVAVSCDPLPGVLAAPQTHTMRWCTRTWARRMTCGSSSSCGCRCGRRTARATTPRRRSWPTSSSRTTRGWKCPSAPTSEQSLSFGVLTPAHHGWRPSQGEQLLQTVLCHVQTTSASLRNSRTLVAKQGQK